MLTMLTLYSAHGPEGEEIPHLMASVVVRHMMRITTDGDDEVIREQMCREMAEQIYLPFVLDIAHLVSTDVLEQIQKQIYKQVEWEIFVPELEEPEKLEETADAQSNS